VRRYYHTASGKAYHFPTPMGEDSDVAEERKRVEGGDADGALIRMVRVTYLTYILYIHIYTYIQTHIYIYIYIYTYKHIYAEERKRVEGGGADSPLIRMVRFTYLICVIHIDICMYIYMYLYI